MPRGGRRKGKPQTAYQNRTDLSERKVETPPTVPGQGYGVQTQQRSAMNVAPLAGQGAPQGPARPQQAPQMGEPPPPLVRPTEKPGQPLTAGAPIGAGPGPEVLPQVGGQRDTLGLYLRELYRAQPSEEVRQLIVSHEFRGQRGPQGPLPEPGVGQGPPAQLGAPPTGPTPPPTTLPPTGGPTSPPALPPSRGEPTRPTEVNA